MMNAVCFQGTPHEIKYFDVAQNVYRFLILVIGLTGHIEAFVTAHAPETSNEDATSLLLLSVGLLFQVSFVFWKLDRWYRYATELLIDYPWIGWFFVTAAHLIISICLVVALGNINEKNYPKALQAYTIAMITVFVASVCVLFDLLFSTVRTERNTKLQPYFTLVDIFYVIVIYGILSFGVSWCKSK